MSRSQFHSIKLFILRHAWLNLWDKHMTTGRINQVTSLSALGPRRGLAALEGHGTLTRREARSSQGVIWDEEFQYEFATQPEWAGGFSLVSLFFHYVLHRTKQQQANCTWCNLAVSRRITFDADCIHCHQARPAGAGATATMRICK